MIGKTISHYRILEKLGEGGMGVVYRAEDTKLRRTVALKFLPPELTRDTQAKERFIQEAQAASALDHPNICTIHEVAETENGETFIAMAYYGGESLEGRIERGPLRLDEALDVAGQIAQGLAKAHNRGIIHRDIKPANILIAEDRLVKIVDFGLAKLRGAKLTRTGSTIGTIGYMSPEQVRGEEADERSDIWSLGVVLYEMLTGLVPFRGEYEQAVIYQIVNARPEPVTGLRAGVPMELERIIGKCLEKSPDERYQTAADLVADLRHLQRTKVGSRETTEPLPPASAKRTRRSRWLYPAALLVIAAGIVSILLVKTQHRAAAPEEKSIAVLPFVDMSPRGDQEYFCDGMTEELINRLSNIQGLRVPARTSAFVFKGKTEDIQDIGAKLKVRTVLEGSVRKGGDKLRITAQLINVADGYHIWSESYDRDFEDVFTIQDEISSAIVDALKLKLTPQEQRKLSKHSFDNVKAYDCYLKASRQIWRFDEKSLDSAFVYLRAAIDVVGDNAELYAGMAEAYFMSANIGIGQEEDIERSEEYARKALALEPDLAIALIQLATLSTYYTDYPENWRDGFRYLKRALASSPYSLDAVQSLAVSYAQIGKPSEALAHVEMFERIDPLNPRRYAVRGVCDYYDCRFESAVEQFRQFYRADSSSRLAVDSYAAALIAVGRRQEALAVIDRTGSVTARDAETLFYLLSKYALLKDREGALHLMTPDLQKTCRRDFDWSLTVAERLSLAGAEEEAIDWLENAVGRGFINYPLLLCDPFLDNIRGEERFKKIVERTKYEWEHFKVPE